MLRMINQMKYNFTHYPNWSTTRNKNVWNETNWHKLGVIINQAAGLRYVTSILVRYSTSLRRRVSLEMCVNAGGWRRSQEDRLSSCRPGHVSEMTSTQASFRKWQQDSSRQTRLSPQAFRKLGGRNQNSSSISEVAETKLKRNACFL